MIFILSPFIWAFFLSLCLVSHTIGLLIIPPLAYFGKYHTRKSKFYDKNIVVWDNDVVNYIYGNEEDGILAGRQYHNYYEDWKQIIYWSAIRNPSNNLRFIPFISFKLDSFKVRFIGSFGNRPWLYDKKLPQWFFAWHGLYSCFYWQGNIFGKFRRFWIGHAIYPTDVYGVTRYRKEGVGFKFQWKPVR